MNRRTSVISKTKKGDLHKPPKSKKYGPCLTALTCLGWLPTPGMNPWDTGLGAATLLKLDNWFAEFEKSNKGNNMISLQVKKTLIQTVTKKIKQHPQIRGADDQYCNPGIHSGGLKELIWRECRRHDQ